MAKGTINLTKSATIDGTWLEGKIEWESTPNAEKNESSVTARIFVKKVYNNTTVSTATTGKWRYEISVNGEGVSGTAYKSVKGAFVEIASHTILVAHNADGSKAIAIEGSVQGPSNSNYSTRTTKGGDNEVDLDTIPRASSISSAANTTLGNTCNIKWVPASASFRYKLHFKIGSWEHTVSPIHPNQTGTYTYGLDTSKFFDAICKASPNSAKPKMTITLTTYSNAACTTQIGDNDNETCTITIPEDDRTKPTLKVEFSPVDTFNGMYIAHHSKIKATFTAGFKLGASQKSCTLQVDGVSYKATDNIAVSGGLLKSGTVKGVVTDTRGFTQSVPMDIEVKPYSDPSISSLECYRCDENGEERDNGTYLRIVGIRTYSYLDGQNACHVEYRIKDQNGEFPDAWTTIWEEDKSENAFAVIEDIQLNVGRAYVVEVRAVDKLKEPDGEQKIIPTQDVYWHRDGSMGSFTFGGYVEEKDTFAIHKNKTFKADGDAYFQGEKMCDFVVEQGVKNGWSYRKWQSGLAECWKTISLTSTMELEWGSLYCTTKANRQTYPFEFAERPTETASLLGSYYSAWLVCDNDAEGVNTVSASARYGACRPTVGAVESTFYIDLQVKGRWK